MLEIKKKITYTGKSSVDGSSVLGFQAQIDTSNPYDISLTSWQINKELYKENRVQCRLDEAEFEDYIYEIQDSLISELNIDEPSYEVGTGSGDKETIGDENIEN